MVYSFYKPFDLSILFKLSIAILDESLSFEKPYASKTLEAQEKLSHRRCEKLECRQLEGLILSLTGL